MKLYKVIKFCVVNGLSKWTINLFVNLLNLIEAQWDLFAVIIINLQIYNYNSYI